MPKTPNKTTSKTAAAKKPEPATLSRPTVETLIDLVEIKLGCMEIYDREDARELQSLEACRDELIALRANTTLPKKAMARQSNGRAAAMGTG